MPNHYYNRVTITGSDAGVLLRLRAFLNAPMAKTCFDLNAVIPMPGYISEADLASDSWESTSGLNWLRWHTQHWGTKWNTYDATVREVAGGVKYTFCTAWGPPLPVIERLVEDWPMLQFVVEGHEEWETLYKMLATGHNGKLTDFSPPETPPDTSTLAREMLAKLQWSKPRLSLSLCGPYWLNTCPECCGINPDVFAQVADMSCKGEGTRQQMAAEFVAREHRGHKPDCKIGLALGEGGKP